uniref:non-specific serine/threonine protein kinase n=1 Tax=Equus caballus TaxID=9796 RepID=A0A9L0SDD8_HORSE
MESRAFPRRLGPAPSAATALDAELGRPLADGLIKSPKPPMKKQAVKRHHHKHNLRHRYEFLETLGKGTYGKVKKARESAGRLVAVKSIRKDRIKDEQDLMHIRREIEIMSSLNHPHIIAIHEDSADIGYHNYCVTGKTPRHPSPSCPRLQEMWTRRN